MAAISPRRAGISSSVSVQAIGGSVVMGVPCTFKST